MVVVACINEINGSYDCLEITYLLLFYALKHFCSVFDEECSISLHLINLYRI